MRASFRCFRCENNSYYLYVGFVHEAGWLFDVTAVSVCTSESVATVETSDLWLTPDCCRCCRCDCCFCWWVGESCSCSCACDSRVRPFCSSVPSLLLALSGWLPSSYSLLFVDNGVFLALLDGQFSLNS